MRKRARHCLRTVAAVFAALLLGALMGSARASDETCGNWPQWQAFRRLYLSEDGRVIDASTAESVTVSEGQSYALMFALIANDPASFAKVLKWTADNLAGGSLEHALPAWKWGRGEGGRWGVLDRNAAADSDLWIAYALSQAARLWDPPNYAALAHALDQLIEREEITLVPGLGATLLPGPRGFVANAAWRLNASYLPLQVLRGLARDDRELNPVLESAQRIITGSSPHGYAADWIQYREADRFSSDPSTGAIGSYNAIRVYLWAGLLPEDDPEAQPLAQLLKPMAVAAAQGALPESIDTRTLETHGHASPGFQASLLPLLVRLKFTAAVQDSRARIEAAALRDNQHYYSDVLTLFGLGWLEGRYRFDRRGELHVQWSRPCRTG